MPRGRNFSVIEEEILIENYEHMTIAELEEELAKQGYVRSRKSINRKLEKLREEGKVGHRSNSTVRRAYKQRTKKQERPEAPAGFEKPDWGDSDWGDSGWGDADWDD